MTQNNILNRKAESKQTLEVEHMHTTFQQSIEVTGIKCTPKSWTSSPCSKGREDLLISKTDSSNSILVQLTGSAVKEKKLSANNIIKDIIKTAGGRGGGKDTFAQGSIENIDKAKEEINKLKSTWL